MPHNFTFIIAGVLAGMERPGTFNKLREDFEFLLSNHVGALVSRTETALEKSLLEEFGFRYLHLPVVLDADDIKFDTDKEELYAKDNVVIITSSATAYAPNAVFIQKEKRIVLTGPSPQPLVIYFEGSRQNKYKADNITFLAGGDRIMLKGNVKAAMTVEDKNAGRGKK